MLVILVLIAGALSISRIQRQKFPAFALDILKISVVYPGASPEDIEVNVIDPIEDELMEVEGIDEIKSISMENFAIIMIYIDPDTSDLRKVKADVRAAIDRVSELPDRSETPQIEELRSTSVPVIELAITGQVPERILREFAHDLEIDIKNVSGVGSIDKVGYRKREIHIGVDHDKLEDMHISLNEVMHAIRARNVRQTGGTLQSYVSEADIVTFSEYEDPLEVSDVIIRSTFTGEHVRISDIADVEEDFEDHTIIARANGEDAISLIIRPQANADIITLSDQVMAEVRQFRRRLPASVKVEPLFDISRYTGSLLKIVSYNALIGFCLVLIVMAFFLDLHTAFWTAFGLPVTILGSFILFLPMGITLNVISLAALILVLGIMVDDAIIIAENVHRFKEKGMEPVAATVQGVTNVLAPIAASTLTTVIAFVPMLYISGIAGKLVWTVPVVVIVVILVSLVESSLLLPCHIAYSDLSRINPLRTRWLGPIVRLYRWFIRICIRFRKSVLIVLFSFSLFVFWLGQERLQTVLFPQEDPNVFFVIIETPRDTPLKATSRKVAEVEAIVAEVVPHYLRQSIITRIGHHDTDAYGDSLGRYDSWALISVYLHPSEERDVLSEDLTDELADRLKLLEGYERISVEAQDDSPPVGKPITVIYSSYHDDIRNKLEKKTIDYLNSIEGIYAVQTSNVPGKNELRLLLDHDQMARFGITAIQVASTVRAAFEGEIVTSIRREGEEIDFRVRLQNPEKYRAEGIRGLLIANNKGDLVPLGSFASLGPARGAAALHHYDGDRSVTITAEVDPRKITSLKASQLIRDKFEPLLLEYGGVTMQVAGEAKRTRESMIDFVWAMLLALIAIYILLVVVFDSYVQPLMVMSVIPYAVVGVILTLILHDLPMSFVATVGLLGLFGVVVNDTIVMTARLNEMCTLKGYTLDAVADGAASRFRAVVLTTVTTFVALLPTAYGIGGKLHFVRPMILVLAWGIAFATVISLVMIPSLYTLLQRIKK